jgi:hypothetical protein
VKGRGTIALVCAVLGLAVAAPAATAATIRVNDNALPAACVGAFPTIQQGVNAAGSGDTVLVCPGYYLESVLVPPGKDNLKIVGKNLPPDLTSCSATRTNTSSPAALVKYSVVQGNGAWAFDVQSNGVTIDSFVVQGPTGSGDTGILTEDIAGGFVIQNDLIQDNAGGMWFDADGSAQSKATRNCFRQNNDGGFLSGDAVFAGDASNELFIGNRSYGNSTSSGVWTDLFGNSPDKITVQGNIATNDVAGYSMNATTNSSVTGNIISGNSADGLCIGTGNTGLVVQGNIIKLDIGDGILVDFCDAVTNFNPNMNVKVTGNIVTSTSDAFLVDGDNLFQNSTVTGNIFKSTGGNGAYVAGTTGDGGNKFTGNIATGGTGFYGCRDDTTGTGTAGTDNTWGDSNIGKPHNLPMALCFPHK